MKRLFYLVLSILILSSCNKSNQFEIHGILKNGAEKEIRLSKLLVSGTETIKTIKTDKNGEFKFKYSTEIPAFFNISVSKTNFITLLIEPEVGDTIKINEYSSTIGSNIPSTPTKLGLYPKFRPGRFLDNTYIKPVDVIRGHDGSITISFGNDLDGNPDIRDLVLLEFETRIYNNVKVNEDIPLETSDVIPGAFNNTEYSQEEIIEVYMGDLVGEQVYDKFGKEFPLLIKFIDARQDLSIQVHPNDELALERHNAYGKTEMWYVIESEEEARIYSGFNKDLNNLSYKNALEKDTLSSLLNADSPREGDVFFIPAGRVHAIGAGNVVAEIQQTSDVTYRIYDWGRMGLDGKPRDLHNDLAIDAIDFQATPERIIRKEAGLNSEEKLVECQYFTTNILNLDRPTERIYVDRDSFVILICTEGSFTVSCDGKGEEVSKGECVLIPASTDVAGIDTSGAKILEVYV